MSSYTYSAGDVIAPGSMPATELLSRVGGFIAGCGEAALGVLLGRVRPQDVTALIQQAVQAHVTVGRLAGSGQASPQTLDYLAQQNGVTLQAMDYRQALASWAGSRDILLGVSNATAFGGADTGVYGHYITVVGRTQNGNYVVSDPNTPESANNQFVQYTPQQIDNAHPFYAAVASSSPNGVPPGPAAGTAGAAQAGAAAGSGADFLAVLQALNPLGPIGDFFGTITGWFTPPIRALKFVLGISLILLAVTVSFLPDVAAGALGAAGVPMSARMLGRTAVQTAAQRATARPRAQREIRTYRRALTAENVREQRIATTRRLRNPVQRAAAPTRVLTPQRSAGPRQAPKPPSTPQAGRLGPLRKNTKTSRQMSEEATKNREAREARERQQARVRYTRRQQAVAARESGGLPPAPFKPPPRTEKPRAPAPYGRTLITKRPISKAQNERIKRAFKAYRALPKGK